jgi:hypothetical protein
MLLLVVDVGEVAEVVQGKLAFDLMGEARK